MAGPSSGRVTWGWHQLTDSWARQIVAEAGLSSRDLVIDIGAGNGALTSHLVGTGAKVIAVELHRRRAASLRERFGQRVSVVEIDAQEFRFPKHPFHVVANPPFSLTGPLLHELLQPGSQLVSAQLVLQRGSAKRWASGEIRGSQQWWPFFELRVDTLVPRSAFHPRPSVDAAVLTINRRKSGKRPNGRQLRR